MWHMKSSVSGQQQHGPRFTLWIIEEGNVTCYPANKRHACQPISIDNLHDCRVVRSHRRMRAHRSGSCCRLRASHSCACPRKASSAVAVHSHAAAQAMSSLQPLEG